MNQLELEFRRELTTKMQGMWTPTIHVENHLNPGVPDLSYVMTRVTPDCETGWLELKALTDAKMVTVKVERSQHQWMTIHASRIPADFLILIGDWCYLVDGVNHRRLLGTVHVADDLLQISNLVFHRSKIREMLPSTLIAKTIRGRNGKA